jgi:elongation factor G
MDEKDPKPETKPSGNRPPPRPPHGTLVGLGPEDDDSDKKPRMTITKAAEGEGKFIRQSGGRDHYGHVIVRIEPNGKGKGNEIRNEITADGIPKEYIEPVVEEIGASLGLGVVDERPIVDIIVRLVGGSSHKTDSNELAFKMAAIFALKDALKKSGRLGVD